MAIIGGASDYYQNQANDNRNREMVTGDQLQQLFQNNANYYGDQEGGYENLAANAYSGLNDQPGYSASDAAAISGDPNAAFKYYDPGDINGRVSGLQGGLNDAAGQGAANLQAVAPAERDAYASTESGLQGAQGAALGEYGSDVGSSLDSLQSQYPMTEAEQQNIKDVAAQTTGGQYRSMQDRAALQAAAQGNTSPAALAAIEEQLGRQGAIDAGNAASSAELNANSAAAQRELTLEQQQQATAGNLYSAKSGAAENEAALEAQGASQVAGTQLSGENSAANLRYNAANTGGQAAVTAGEYNQNTGENLASNADQTASGRAKSIADTSLAGQQQYRNYLTGEQGTSQQGQQANDTNRVNAYSSEYGAANNATATGSNAANNQASNNTQLAGSVLSGAAGALSSFADGAVVTRPTVARIGERGPEKVISLAPRKRYRMAA